jgi:hypothetical protein
VWKQLRSLLVLCWKKKIHLSQTVEFLKGPTMAGDQVKGGWEPKKRFSLVLNMFRYASL